MKSIGRWMLHTLGSRHLLDLDIGTVERFPGPDAEPTVSAGVHGLRRLIEVRIGRPGRWTMPGDYLVEYYWYASSVIRHIERLPGLAPAHHE